MFKYKIKYRRADNLIVDFYCMSSCIQDAKEQLNGLSKLDLIRLTNKLRFHSYKLYIDVDFVANDKKLNFFEDN